MKLIVVILQLSGMKTFAHLIILVMKMREIVILQLSAKIVLFVDQIIVQHLLDLVMKLIVVRLKIATLQQATAMETGVFALVAILVGKMKATVIMMVNAMLVLYVEVTIVHLN